MKRLEEVATKDWLVVLREAGSGGRSAVCRRAGLHSGPVAKGGGGAEPCYGT